MSHWRTYLDSDVIRYVDLGGREHTVQIASVKKGKVTGGGGKANAKAMLFFAGRDKPYGAGTTVLSTIANIYGNDTKDWKDQWITLWPDPSATYGGQAVGGVRVRPMKPSAEQIAAGQADIEARKVAAAEAAKQATAEKRRG